MIRRAFTLIEVMLAITLTALLMVATWTWLTAASRTGDALRQRLDGLEEATAIARLMSDDLALRVAVDGNGARCEGDHAFACRTLATVPGQGQRGIADVRWSWTATEGIVRTAGDARRGISRSLGFVLVPSGTLPVRWSCRFVPAGSSTASSEGASSQENRTISQGQGGWSFPLAIP